MKPLVAVLVVVPLLGLVSACGSGDDQDVQGKAHDAEAQGDAHMMTKENKELPSSNAWVRPEPIDVRALDLNGDGFVYQDPMDWNVIADEEGRCPVCGMFLKKVTIAEATQHLHKFGFEVAGADLPEGMYD